MYTYHQYPKWRSLPDPYVDNTAKTYRVLQNFDIVDKENSGHMYPGFTHMEFSRTEDLFDYVDAFCREPGYEWHVFGNGSYISDCVEPNTKGYKAKLGILGIPK